MTEFVPFTRTYAVISSSPFEDIMDRLRDRGLPVRFSGAERVTWYHLKVPDLREIVTPSVELVDRIFASRTGIPWNLDRENQLASVGSLATLVECLLALEAYHETRSTLPCPNEHWALRCNESVGIQSYAVNYCPYHGLSVDQRLLNKAASTRIGALITPNQ